MTNRQLVVRQLVPPLKPYRFISGVIASMLLLSINAQAQPSFYDWPSQNLNIHNSRYAALDQVNQSNVNNLTESWTFTPGPQDSITQVTPLVANGTMYLHSANTLYALDATTGEEYWRRALDAGMAGGPVRGSTYADGRIYAYRGADLYAFDANTGDIIRSFGDTGVSQVITDALNFKYPDVYPNNTNPINLGYRLTTPPTIHNGKMYVAACLLYTSPSPRDS